MFIDLHTHSVSSDDSRAAVEQYVKWVGVLRRKGYTLDGFVLTEHRKFDFDKDYSGLAEENGVLIMKGSELDTDMGHFLVYGVTEALTDAVDFSDVTMDAMELVRAAERNSARLRCPRIRDDSASGCASSLRTARNFRADKGGGGSERIEQTGRAGTGGGIHPDPGRACHRWQRRAPSKRNREVHDEL